MQVTKVEALTKTKWKVELDGQFAFVLYKKEISRFGIEVNGELSEELYEECRVKKGKIAGDAFADRYGKDRITIEG